MLQIVRNTLLLVLLCTTQSRALKTVQGIQFGFSDINCDAKVMAPSVDSVLKDVGIFPTTTTVVETNDEPDLRRRNLRRLGLPSICRACENRWGVGVCVYWYGYCNLDRRTDEVQSEAVDPNEDRELNELWSRETVESLTRKCNEAVYRFERLSYVLDPTCDELSFYCNVIEA